MKLLRPSNLSSVSKIFETQYFSYYNASFRLKSCPFYNAILAIFIPISPFFIIASIIDIAFV